MTLDDLEKQFGLTPIPTPKDSTDNLRKEDGAALTEMGNVGTRITNKSIAIEPTAKYRPRLVRGSSGNPKVYEEILRGEPLALDSFQSYTELLVAGTYQLQVPEETPLEFRPYIKQFVDFYQRKLFDIEGGWTNFVEHAASCMIFGFAPFEIVWATDEKGRKYPRKIAFREQNTVEDWILDAKGNDLEEIRFQTGGDHPTYYTLPKSKFLLVTLNRRGNNFEGISCLRPALHWVKFKRILAQIAALSAEKYGVPIVQIKSDPQSQPNNFATPSDETRKQQLRNVYAAMRSSDAPVLEMPDGLKAEMVNPSGSMPKLLELIQYCDLMIASCFSNEGSLLGLQSSVGSYALGAQKERDFLRSAPFYARRILDAVNQTIIRPLFKEWFDQDLVCPQLVYRVDGMKDSSRYLEDINKMLPNGQWQKRPEIAKAVYQELGIEYQPKEEKTTQPTETKKASDTALNGAQVTSMVNVVSQVAQGLLPVDSAAKILAKAFLISEAEALSIVSPAANAANAALAETVEEPPGTVRDEYAKTLGKTFAQIAQQHRNKWAEVVGPLTDAEEIEAQATRLEQEFRPRYLEAAENGAEQAAKAASRDVSKHLDIDGKSDGSFSQSARIQARAIGEQAFNRIQGFLREQQAEAVRAVPVDGEAKKEFTFKIFKTAIFESLGDKAVVNSILEGRDRVLSAIKEEKGKKIIAVRIDPSTTNSCGPCKSLNGFRTEYGSDEYYEYSPPAKCRGRNGCLCYWKYELED